MRAPPDGQADLARTGTTAGAAQDETVHTTANHPWLTTDRGWVLAGDLHSGEPIVREGGGAAPATVTALRVVAGAADYYNLTVSVLHTYAVGTGQFVVHNTCGPQTLRHYTTESGYNDITRTGQIKVSNAELDPVHARHGTSVYLTDLRPEGGFTQGQISKRLWNNPFVMRARKLNYFVDVDVTGLRATEVAPHNFLVPAQNINVVARGGDEFGDFTGHIVGGGIVDW